VVDSKPSKTARKREQLELQKLGERLIELNPEELLRLPLEERLSDAIRQAQRIKSNSALRRQRQYIGKLMRQVDATPIREALDEVTRKSRTDKRLFAQAESWRDRIASEGTAAIEAFRQATNNSADELPALFEELERASNDRARRIARRKLFRAINDVLVARHTDDRISK
jgi:ribosome-associated protein